jgi:hypothetical protein
MNTRITPQLLDVLREEIRLDWHGIHGVSRRARVRDNGLLLCCENLRRHRCIGVL